VNQVIHEKLVLLTKWYQGLVSFSMWVGKKWEAWVSKWKKKSEIWQRQSTM